MMPEYTVLSDQYMYHVDRQRGYETECYGCREDYGTRWPHGILLAVITDRSGSEQVSCHNNLMCIGQAIQRLEEDDDA